MFLKGFICGSLGMAAIIIVLIWGMSPRVAAFTYEPAEGVGYAYRDC
jgi:hypothetical protein